MAISGNRLAKYLVMVSQVVAWCTVSVMLLRKGLNQVHGVTQYSNNKETMVSNYGSTTNKTTTTMNVNHAKSFDDSGTPAVVAGIIMIAIAVIMLIISPTIMLMKIIEKRKKRIRNAELESPPKYEDVVESAPRYSSLFVFNNDGEMTLLSENIHKEADNIQK